MERWRLRIRSYVDTWVEVEVDRDNWQDPENVFYKNGGKFIRTEVTDEQPVRMARVFVDEDGNEHDESEYKE